MDFFILNINLMFKYIYRFLSYENEHNKILAIESADTRNYIMTACLEQQDKQQRDSDLVSQGMADCHNDMIAINSKLALCIGNSGFFSTPVAEAKPGLLHRKSLRKDILSSLKELLGSYPEPPMKEKSAASKEELSDFFDRNEEHHAQILALVETYLPDTYAEIQSLELACIDHKNAYHTNVNP